MSTKTSDTSKTSGSKRSGKEDATDHLQVEQLLMPGLPEDFWSPWAAPVSTVGR